MAQNHSFAGISFCIISFFFLKLWLLYLFLGFFPVSVDRLRFFYHACQLQSFMHFLRGFKIDVNEKCSFRFVCIHSFYDWHTLYTEWICRFYFLLDILIMQGKFKINRTLWNVPVINDHADIMWYTKKERSIVSSVNYSVSICLLWRFSKSTENGTNL